MEALSEHELNKVVENHAVDFDFLARVVGCQIATEARKQAAAGRSDCHVPILNLLSKETSRCTSYAPLYSLGTDPSQVYAGILSLVLHPDGKTLICGGHGFSGDPTVLSLWDLPSKKRIRSFFGHIDGVSHCFFTAGRVVSFSHDAGNLRIWNMSGMCEHSVDFDEGYRAVASGREVFISGCTNIISVDILTGDINHTVPYKAWNLFQLESGRLLVFNDASTFEDFEEENLPNLAVLDQASLVELSRFEHLELYYDGVDTNGQGHVVGFFGR